MNNIQLERRNSLKEDEATFIATCTKDEEKLETRSVEAIQLNALDGCIIAKCKKQVIGCFFLRKYGENKNHENDLFHKKSLLYGEHIYERATLRVHKDHRKSGKYGKQYKKSISKCLNEALITNAKERNLISISSNPLIIKRNTSAGMTLVERKKIIKEYPLLWDIICEDDLSESHQYEFMISQKLMSILNT